MQERHSSLDLPVNRFACKVTALVGPPCAGKTSMARASAGSSDVIVDLDMIATALTSTPMHHVSTHVLPFILRVRSCVYQLLTERNDIPRAWLILGAPLRSHRQELRERGADVVLLKPELDECYARALSDPTRSGNADGWLAHIDKWFAAYEPD